MKFYVVVDNTGYPVVAGEEKLARILNQGPEIDVAGAYASYDAAMDAVVEMRQSRAAVEA